MSAPQGMPQGEWGKKVKQAQQFARDKASLSAKAKTDGWDDDPVEDVQPRKKREEFPALGSEAFPSLAGGPTPPSTQPTAKWGAGAKSKSAAVPKQQPKAAVATAAQVSKARGTPPTGDFPQLGDTSASAASEGPSWAAQAREREKALALAKMEPPKPK